MSVLDEFKFYLEQQGKSENTSLSYLKNVGLYLKWFDESKGVPFTKLYRENVREYISFLKTVKDHKPKTINTKINALVKFNEFLIDKQIQNNFVLHKSDYQRVQEQYVSLSKFEKKDIERFRQIVLESNNIRNYALVTLLAYAGLRISEALDLKIKDINFVSREIVVEGKGNKTRIVFMNDLVKDTLQSYLKKRNQLNLEHDFIFVSNRGKKLDRTTVNKFFKNYSETFGQKLTPHDLRHFFCSNALKVGFSVEEVANQAGHSSIYTTMLYTHPSREEIIDKMNKL
ncbi:tyrosine-type recombinase/integrase [Pallidibacillus thermolactis]|uniref:tyrosine-type recombinase/integrase n=1 Tax=Pallidibacillus thermolactis TaxID=251051 RepID=UPI0021D8D0E4|nr:tyrosine-type recombinase/integrase [Pallidibacillus thermolactis]MCU9601755.1 tyrosine-type recombinase/integrase [Pallidibacillus thermolactis subsp. kokeshiiformis]